MIPLAFIQQWTTSAPWSDLRQVEQDLIISRALCDLFTSPALRDRIAFRGGTAIHKLLFQRPLRYSEDIDLVQTRAEPVIRRAKTGHSSAPKTGHHVGGIGRKNPLVRTCWQGAAFSS